jgi:hypothetical protein
MVIPTVFGLDIRSTAADVAHLGGALIVTVSFIAMGEPLRLGRYCNVLLGAGVAVLPWFVNTVGALANLNMAIAGTATIFLALPRGPKRERYGLWDRFVR